MVYGDYDVDGCTAVALVYKFLQQYYSNIDYYIPDRYEEGYGVSVKGIDYAYESEVKLIIVLDCGIKAVDEIAYAKRKGYRLHYLRPPRTGRNPSAGRGDSECQTIQLNLSLSPFVRLRRRFQIHASFAQSNGIEFSQLIPLLDLCAVSIASDIVPIMGENRIPGLPRPTATECQPEHRAKGHHRRMRLVGTGADHQ